MKNLEILVSLFSMLILFTLAAPLTASPENFEPSYSTSVADQEVSQLEIVKFENMATKRETADAWLSIAVQEIKAKITKLKVHDTGQLLSSVRGSIQELSGGDAYKASLLYNYYGIFPDMGIGKGIQKGDANVAKMLGFKRKTKPWTKEIAAQRHRFGEVMQTAFASQAIENVKGSLLKKIEFKA